MSLILLLMSSLAITYLFMLHMGQPLKNITYGSILSGNIGNKNLTLPFPPNTTLYLNSYDTRYSHEQNLFMGYFGKPFDEFKEILNGQFIYTEDYDCKYWAYVWTLYWKENKDKYNWKLDYLTTGNHVFVMVYNESGYIILDGDDQINMMN